MVNANTLYLLFSISTTNVYTTSIIKCVLWEGHYVLVHHTTVSLFHEQKLLLLLCLDTTKCKCSWSPQVCSLWCYLSKQWWWTHKGPSSKRFLISCHKYTVVGADGGVALSIICTIFTILLKFVWLHSKISWRKCSIKALVHQLRLEYWYFLQGNVLSGHQLLKEIIFVFDSWFF